jgi:hypothetical protein
MFTINLAELNRTLAGLGLSENFNASNCIHANGMIERVLRYGTKRLEGPTPVLRIPLAR